jgi:hypothetical protein
VAALNLKQSYVFKSEKKKASKWSVTLEYLKFVGSKETKRVKGKFKKFVILEMFDERISTESFLINAPFL